MDEKDPSGISAKDPGSKLDSGKSPIFRGVVKYFPDAVKAVGLLSEFGANKYTWYGWHSVDDGINRYSDALLRHLIGEVANPYDDSVGGTNFHHAVNVAWNALARLQLILEQGTPAQKLTE